MPCTQHDDQEQCRRVSFRTTFSRNIESLRFGGEQLTTTDAANTSPRYWITPTHSYAQDRNNLQNYQVALISPSPHMPSSSSLSSSQNPVQDVTDQIRISVQEAHINTARQFANDIGGNLDDVLDSFVENAQDFDNEAFIHDETSSSNPAEDEQHHHHHHNNHHSHHQHQLHQNATLADSRRDDIYTAETSQNNTATATSQHYLVSAQQTERILDEEECNQLTEDFEKQYEDATDIKPAEYTSDANITTIDESALINSSERFSNLTVLPSDLHEKLTLNNQDYQRHVDEESIPLAIDEASCQDDNKPLRLFDAMPSFTHNRQVGVIKNQLYNGSSFTGYQRSSKESYEVNVTIKHVDFENSHLSGYLCINHLTHSHPSLTTFFEGEIISRQYPFLTKKWGANEEKDRDHWSMFEHFEQNYSGTFNLDCFDYDELKQSDYIYMRWKEHFLVPDHTIKHVEGASYAGFYYICYSKRTSSIRGYYFHINSEQFESFQSLELELDPRGYSEVYELR